MPSARSGCCCFVLALCLGGACTVTVEPIKLAKGCPEGAAGCGGAAGSSGVTSTGGTTGSGGADAGIPGDAAGKCTGYTGVDADPGGILSQGLVAYYSCEQAAGLALPDQSGSGRDATLASSGTGGAIGYRFAAGRVGKALYLSSASDAHVVLPNGMLASACESTVATWVLLNRQTTWQRIWTFAASGAVYMYLTTNNDTTGVVRTGITLTANGAEQQYIDGPSVLPTGAWTHVAVVLGPAGLALYINGVQVAASSSVTLRPADMGRTTHDYIGRSNFSWDPYLDSGIDEFRVYNRALSPAEIQALSSGS